MNRIKKIYMLIITLLIITAFPSRVNANPQTVVKVEPYQNVFGLGQQFATNITITDAQNLFGLEVRLYWNSSILQLLKTGVMLGLHPNGVLYGNILKSETNSSGEYLLYGTSIGSQTPSFNGSGTIVTVTFNVTSIGSCELTLQTKLYDKALPGSAANPIEHSSQNGYYTPIYISTSPSDIFMGESSKISGYIIPKEEKINVTIQYRRQGEVNWLTLGNAMTDKQGNYTLEWKPQEDGTYQIKAFATVQNAKIESAIANISVTSKSNFWFYIYLIIAIVAIAIVILILYTRFRKTKARKAKKS